MRLPLRMSRTFGESELVEGRIVVGFYHDGVQVAQGGSTLMGPQGGTLNQDGLTLTFDQGAFSGSTLVRLSVIPGDPAALWADVVGQGTIVKSFQVDIVGQLFKGMRLKVAGIGSPAQMPILVQRRVVQGQRLVVAVGGLQPVAGSLGDWELAIPAEGNPLMEGGSFAILVPTQTWAWVTGTAVMDPGLAQGIKTRAAGSAKSLRLAPMVAGEPTPVGDAVVQAGYLPAVSGLDGHFAVPVFTTPATNTLQGQRWDLGVSGSLDAVVPSSGNRLQLSSVPFQVVTALPAEGAQVAPGSVLTLLLSGPADPMTTGNARLYRVVPVPQVAPANLKVTAKKGTSPSAAVKSKAKPKVSAKVSTKGAKTALLLQEPIPTELVEVVLRRNLSQDGKTLLLTPDQPLALGTSFVLVVDGLQSLGGQTAPQLVRNFKTMPQALSAVVDFRRFKVTYPDSQLNVTVTVPVGAAPARATVQVEAPEMGAVGAGVMPDGQALAFQLKAALGQRLTARVQLYSGEVIEGFLSRYESTDGSGRVTLGIDGGRVEAVDGSGAAMTLPEGSLDKPAELKVQFTQETSPILKGQAAEVPIWGRVQLLADRSLGLKKIPVIEMAAPADAVTLSQDNPRIGTYAVAYRTDGFDVDGSPSSSYMVCDTADVENGKFKSKGGFPYLPVILDDDVQLPTVQVKGNQPGLMAKVRPLQAAASTGPVCPAQEGLFPAPTVMQWGVFGYSLNALMLYPVASSSRGFDVELDGMIVKNPGKVILQGKAVRRLPGDAYSTPAIMASLFYSAAGDGDVRSNGRFMQYTNECGSYMLMNAYFFDEVLTETGTVLGVERDYGATAMVRIPAKAASVDTAKDRKYFEMDTLRFYVEPQQLGDLTPPWARMDLWQNGQPVEPDNVKVGELEVQIRARDNKKGAALRVELRLDQLQPILCGANGSGVSSSSYDYTPAGDMGLWRIRIQVPAGAHTLEGFISDEGASGPSPQPMGNTTKLSKQISVLDFTGGNRPVDPANPPSFTVQVEGGLQAARPDTSIRVDFNEPVKNVSLTTLTLEKSVGGAWQAVADCRLRSGLVGVDQTTIAYLIPPSRLELGSTYRVSGSTSIVDLDSPPKPLAQAPVTFVVQQYQSLGTVNVGSAGQVSAVGNTAFVITGRTPNVAVSMLQLNSGSLDLMAQVGLTGQGSGFMTQGINTIRAFENVTTQNFPGPGLLLVTTTPQPDRYQDSSCLWGFRFCGARGEVELVFGVSLGRGSVGYAPTVDYRDGVIAVGRLTSSVQLISLDNAIAKWNGDVAGTITPVGNNQGAVFQPFWLSDPDYFFTNQSTFGSTHYGVALVPTATQGTDFIRVAVANNNYESQWRGTSIAGLPQMWIPYTAGALSTPVAPFIADAASVPYSEVIFAPPAHAYLQLGPNIGNSTQHVLAWPDAEIEAGGQRYTTTLLVAISRSIAPAGGNSLILSDANDPSKYWVWPNVSPLPNGGDYEIQYRKISLDPATGMVAVLVRPQGGGNGFWILLDINRPENPQIVGRVLASAGYSSANLTYGKLYLPTENGELTVLDILTTADVPLVGIKQSVNKRLKALKVNAQTVVVSICAPEDDCEYEKELKRILDIGYANEDLMAAYTILYEHPYDNYAKWSTEDEISNTIGALIDVVYNKADFDYDGDMKREVLGANKTKTKYTYEVYSPVRNSTKADDRRDAVASADLKKMMDEAFKERNIKRCSDKIKILNKFNDLYLDKAKKRREAGVSQVLQHPRTAYFFSEKPIIQLKGKFHPSGIPFGISTSNEWRGKQFYEEPLPLVSKDGSFKTFRFHAEEFAISGIRTSAEYPVDKLPTLKLKANVIAPGGDAPPYPIVESVTVKISTKGFYREISAVPSGVGRSGKVEIQITDLPFGKYTVKVVAVVNPAAPSEGTRVLEYRELGVVLKKKLKKKGK